MNLEFVGQNIHFAINLLISLSLFSVFWLIFDAWTQRKRWVEAIKWGGFLLLAIGFLLNAAIVEQANLNQGLAASIVPNLAFWLRCAGYALLIGGQLADPLMKRPIYVDEFAPKKKITKKSTAVGMPAMAGTNAVVKAILVPILPLSLAILYWRRATTGLERHLKPLAYGFVCLALFELFKALGAWRTTTDPLVYDVVRVYGPVWWLSHVAILIASIIFGKWVWQYLTKRLSSQIFIVLVTTTVGMYFASTVGFSYLLLGNTRTQALSDLSTASRVLDYAVASDQSKLQAQAEAVANQPGITTAVQASDHDATVDIVGTYAAKRLLGSVIITNADGKVLFRSEDPARWGDSISQNNLVQRALIGRSATSVATVTGVISPSLQLVTVQPIRGANDLIIGTAIVSKTISNAFVDGIKRSTGLDSTIYAADQRSATTLTTADGQSRAVGIKETNRAVINTVLKQGRTFSGETKFQSQIYLAAYAPLKDADNNTVGMLLVARPASALLAAASKSIELAFLTAVGLLILSIIPVYLIARKIAGGVK